MPLARRPLRKEDWPLCSAASRHRAGRGDGCLGRCSLLTVGAPILMGFVCSAAFSLRLVEGNPPPGASRPADLTVTMLLVCACTASCDIRKYLEGQKRS